MNKSLEGNILGESPLERYKNAGPIIENLKNRISILNSEADKYYESAYKNTRNSEINIRETELENHPDYLVYKELNERIKLLSEELNSLYDEFKSDPSIMIGSSLDLNKQELEYQKNRLDHVNSSLSLLNEEARREFFANGAVDEEGNPNKAYSDLKEKISPLASERQDLNNSDAIFRQEVIIDNKQSDLEDNLGYKKLFNGLDLFDMSRIDPLKNRLLEVKAYMELVKDKGYQIDLEGPLNIFDEASELIIKGSRHLEEIKSNLYNQGVRIKYEDLKPYLSKDKQE